MAAGCACLLATQWPARKLGLVIRIPRLRWEVTFPGLDMEEQPVPVCRRVFDNAVLRIISFLLRLLVQLSAFIFSWIYLQGLETCSLCHIVPAAFVLLVI